jgi:uncharacterized membrane protein YccC
MKGISPVEISLTSSMGLFSSKPMFLSPATGGVNTRNSERANLLLQGGKTALAAALCYWLSLRFGLPEGYWSAISAIIVLQSNVGSTVAASRDRLIGTAIGALIGWAASPWGPHLLAFGLAILVAFLICGSLELKNSSRLAGVTVCIVMLVQRNDSHWRIALDRFFEVSMGIVVALAISTFVLPRRARLHLQQGLAQEFGSLGLVFETIMQGFRNEPHENLTEQKQALESLVRANEGLLKSARSEPSSGVASLEGLAMLSESGRALLDVVLALDLAVRESAGDQFASRYEPELGNLIDAIARNFPRLAKCIQQWQFDSARTAVDMEGELKALESRVSEVRHTSVSFPLNEMLRIYAVQLHLKQIARLLQGALRDGLEVAPYTEN